MTGFEWAIVWAFGIGIVGLNVATWWQIHQLAAEVEGLRIAVDGEEQADDQATPVAGETP